MAEFECQQCYRTYDEDEVGATSTHFTVSSASIATSIISTQR